MAGGFDGWLLGAQLIILRAGATEGLWWEIKRVFETASPDRVIFLMLRIERSAYESFARRVRAELGIRLPAYNEVRNGIQASGFFAFGHGWEPRFLALKTPFWRTSPWKPMLRLFQQALQPVFQTRGVDWQPPPISAMRIAAAGVAGVLFLFVAFVALLDPRNAFTEDSPLSAPMVENSEGGLEDTKEGRSLLAAPAGPSSSETY